MNLFESLGIKVDDDLASFVKEKAKFKKLDPSLFDKLDQMLKLIPTLIDAKYYNSDVYRVIYDKGIGVLQKSAQYPGMLLGNVVEQGTNNKIVDAALLQALSSAPQVLNATFNAMSIVTGQYFMSRIDARLKNLERNVEAIQIYLEESRRSELYGNLGFLNETRHRLPYYAEDTILASSTLTSVQTIKINSLAKLTSYQEQIERLIKTLLKDDKLEEILTNINDMYRLISEYWFALQLYCYSSYLEPQITQNAVPQIIHSIAEDIESKCEEYRKQYESWKGALEKYVENAKAFEENQIFKHLKDTDLIRARNGREVLVQGVAKLFGTIAHKMDAKKKGKNHEIAFDVLTKNVPNTDMESIMEMRKELLLLEQIYSDRLEIVKVDGEIYYRIGEEPLQNDSQQKKKKSTRTSRKAQEA